MAKAKEEANRAKKEELRLLEEERLLKATSELRLTRAATAMAVGASSKHEESDTSGMLCIQASKDVEAIKSVAARSGNLKGGFVRILKDSATSLAGIVADLSGRSTSVETKMLQVKNDRLEAELSGAMSDIRLLREEVERLKKGKSVPSPAVSPVPSVMEVAEFPPLPKSSARPSGVARSEHLVVEEFRASIMRDIGGMMDAKLEGLKDRLLPEVTIRPPLGKSGKAAAVAPRAQLEGDKAQAAAAAEASSSRPKGKGKMKKSEGTKTAPIEYVSTPGQLPPAPVATEAAWTTVVKRSARNKRGRAAAKAVPLPAAPAPAAPQEKPGRSTTQQKEKKKPYPPRTTAVVLTLQPGAQDSGVTYASLISEARSKIDLESVGLNPEQSLSIRETVTGARVLRVPGAASDAQADALAQKLREIMPAELVRIDRPVKRTDMRITGLDESITVAEVVAAVSRSGGCPEESIKTGVIRFNKTGTGSLWASCPVAAAIKVASGRLLVGWTSARVTLLDAAPMRCVRCFEVGHAGAKCTASVDLSAACMRCGQPGHRAAMCSADPHCVLCATDGKPSDHRVGAKSCAHLKMKKTTRSGTGAKTPSAASGAEPMAQ